MSNATATRPNVAALLARADLKYVTTTTAPHCTYDRYVTLTMTGSDYLTYQYVARAVTGDLVGRVRRDIREPFGAAVATLPDGTVVARGEVSECVLALWQIDAGSLSPLARRAMARV